MNHGQDIPAYGLWSLVLINSAVFIIFAFSFFKPMLRRRPDSFHDYGVQAGICRGRHAAHTPKGGLLCFH